MLLPKFEYHEPSTLEEALRLLSELGGNAKLLAGGTDVLVRMKLKVDKPSHLISLARIPGLADIVPRDKHGVTVGAGVSAAKLACHELIRDRFTPLALAASRLGAPMVRNRATIGGNLVNGRPAADLPRVHGAQRGVEAQERVGRERRSRKRVLPRSWGNTDRAQRTAGFH